MFQWLYTLAPTQVTRLTLDGTYLLYNLVFPPQDYCGYNSGRIRYALAAMLCILHENDNLDQGSAQKIFDELIDRNLPVQTIINIGAFVPINSTLSSQPAKITFNNYIDFYERPFDEAIAKNIPQEEWHQWGIKEPLEYLSTSHQAPLLLMAISQYNPSLAVHLVRTALCIDANCGRGSNNRDNAAISIPFLQISEASRQQLFEEAFLLTNMDQFKDYLANGNDRDHYNGYYEYLSLRTRAFIQNPREVIISQIKESPRWNDLEKSGIFKTIDMDELNLVGLYKLLSMGRMNSYYNTKEIILEKTVTTETLNSQSWFNIETRGAGTFVRISAIEDISHSKG